MKENYNTNNTTPKKYKIYYWCQYSSTVILFLMYQQDQLL